MEEGRPPESIFDFVQGITRLARDKTQQDARLDMEKMFEQKIMLTLWVKVKGGWSDDERALKSLGYSDI